MDFGKLLNFLIRLGENNTKEWFAEHKDEYQVLHTNFKHFSDFLINEIQQFDKSVTGIQGKDTVFRIYRDVRFSKDKSPYKDNFGSFIVPGGKKSGKAGYYLHIQPGSCFIAGGIYMPPGDILSKVRTQIYAHIDEFKELIHQPDFIHTFGAIEGEKLKKAPKGFSEDFSDIDLLKFKSYTVMHRVTDQQLQSDDLFQKVVAVYRTMAPFNKFLNDAF